MSIPKLLSVPFAKEGRKNIIPDERTPEMAAQLSSYASGFPAITMQKKEDGGLPPDGMDFNGILYELSDHVVYLNKGGFYKRDESFMSAIGGYPKGVILQADDMNLYVSLADKNTAGFTDKSKWSIIGLVDIKSLLDNKVSSESLAASLELKQDALTFTGTGDVVRKSVTDALDKRVTTAQSSADSALKEAKSKQDKLEFIGSGKVMKEGAYGIGQNGATGERFIYTYPSSKANTSPTSIVHAPSFNTVSQEDSGAPASDYAGINISRELRPVEIGVSGRGGSAKLWFKGFSSSASSVNDYIEVYQNKNTRADKNGVLHATTGTPINTLNVSDMSQSVVNRDDITVTSGAVFRADSELKRELIDSTPVGIIHAYVSETPPNDTWLLCRGQTFSASKYPLLAKIFPDLRVPDLRGVALRGLDAGKNYDPDRALLSYQEDTMQQVKSVTNGLYAQVFRDDASGVVNWQKATNIKGAEANSGAGAVLTFDLSKGARTSHETAMKNVAVNFIIKAK